MCLFNFCAHFTGYETRVLKTVETIDELNELRNASFLNIFFLFKLFKICKHSYSTFTNSVHNIYIYDLISHQDAGRIMLISEIGYVRDTIVISSVLYNFFLRHKTPIKFMLSFKKLWFMFLLAVLTMMNKQRNDGSNLNANVSEMTGNL